MNSFRRRTFVGRLQDECGSVLLLCIFMLVILTVIGVSLSRTSVQELWLSANERDYQRALYAAEAGAAHMRAALAGGLLAGNQGNLASGGSSDWDFALNDPNLKTFTTALDNYSYTASLSNNNDGGSATNDTDGLVLIRSVGSGPNNSSATVELLVQANVTTDSNQTNDYGSQAGGGSGKNYNSNDSEAVSDFSKKMIR